MASGGDGSFGGPDSVKNDGECVTGNLTAPLCRSGPLRSAPNCRQMNESHAGFWTLGLLTLREMIV